jgi:hypothetical protein
MKFVLPLVRMITALIFTFSAVAGAQAENAKVGTLSNSEALITAERWATVVG